MAYNCSILLGRITKVSGYEGAVTVKLEKAFTENLPHMESVFLEIEGKPVPFFISDSEYSGADILKLSFLGYQSVEKVSEFVGSQIFLNSNELESTEESLNGYIKGYDVFISDSIHLGTITGILENPGQWLLVITSVGGKEILIPFHEDFIVSINKRKKSVHMDLPDGLVDIN